MNLDGLLALVGLGVVLWAVVDLGTGETKIGGARRGAPASIVTRKDDGGVYWVVVVAKLGLGVWLLLRGAQVF